MKKTHIIIAASILGLALFVVGSFMNNSDSTADSSVDNNVEQIATVERYEEYSEDGFNSSSNTERIVFFHASWCPACIEHEKDIISSGVPEGITVFKADFDSDTDLRQKYGVNVQSTFVHIDSNGEVVKRWPFGGGIRDVNDLFSQVI